MVTNLISLTNIHRCHLALHAISTKNPPILVRAYGTTQIRVLIPHVSLLFEASPKIRLNQEKVDEFSEDIDDDWNCNNRGWQRLPHLQRHTARDTGQTLQATCVSDFTSWR